MGRKSNAKKQRQQGQPTGINEHIRNGKQLIAPFMQFKNMKPVSWANESLPEYIWVALIFSQHDREEAIGLIKQIGEFFFDLNEDLRPADFSVSGLAKLESSVLHNFLDLVCNKLYLKGTLQPLMLFEDIPAKDYWRTYLDPLEDANLDWEILHMTVARSFNHQSQEATDCRWARVLFFIVTGKLQTFGEKFDEIINYPYVGDMRIVRPTIRSTEMLLNMNSNGIVVDSDWCKYFWGKGLEETPC